MPYVAAITGKGIDILITEATLIAGALLLPDRFFSKGNILVSHIHGFAIDDRFLFHGLSPFTRNPAFLYYYFIPHRGDSNLRTAIKALLFSFFLWHVLFGFKFSLRIIRGWKGRKEYKIRV